MATNTIPLQRLFELFGKSVNDTSLPPEVRELAARQMTLTSHVMRIEAGAAKRLKAADEQIAELVGMMQTLIEQRGGAPAVDVAAPTTAAPAPTSATPTAEAPESEQQEDEDEDTAFAKKILAETEAEVAAINAKAPDVTPLPVKKVAK